MSNEDFVFDGTDKSSSESKVNALTLLEQRLSKKLEKPPLVLAIPARPGITVSFDTNVPLERIEAWRKACRNKRMENQFDTLKFSAIILANQSRQVIVDGEPIVDDDGEDVTLRSDKMADMLGASTMTNTRAVETVKALFGYDGHVLQAANQILKEAGYDESEADGITDENPILSS